MFNFIYKGKAYTNTSREFMLNLGMDEEQIESVLQQKHYEDSQNKALKAAAYVRESDPLYIDWQKELARNNPLADEFKTKWLDKVSEIESRYSEA